MIKIIKLTSVLILLCLQVVQCTPKLSPKSDKKVKTLQGSRPNIIFVMTDDQGMGDLSCMGNEILQTPNLDDFYQKSTRFTQYLVSPTCAPSRAAIMSGRHPFHVGVTHTIQQRERMALDAYTLPQVLQSAAYQTALFGKWHLGDEEQKWRYVNNKFLFDIENDPFEKQNIIHQRTDLAEHFKEHFDTWWNAAVPLMVNENLPRIQPENYPLVKKYYKQKAAEGIADWSPKKY